MESIRVRLKFDSCLTIDVKGRNSGLTVLWKNKIKCNVLNYSQNFINLEIDDEVRGKRFLTCYYGFPERSFCHKAWDMLCVCRDRPSVLWCVIGDFNDLLA